MLLLQRGKKEKENTKQNVEFAITWHGMNPILNWSQRKLWRHWILHKVILMLK